MGPPGPTGPPGYALISAYGGKYNNISRMIDTPKTGTWVQVPLIENMYNINIIDSKENSITLEQDGVYEINYFINVTPNKTVTLTVMIRDNTVMMPETVLTKQVSANDNVSLNGNTIVELSAGHTLDMQLSVTEDNVSINFGPGITASLNVKKLDEAE